MTTDKQPIAATRSIEAIDFTDRLRLLATDAHLIELAVNGAESGDDSMSIVLALRKLRPEIEVMVDEVLPPLPEAERKRLEAHFGKEIAEQVVRQ